MPTPARALPWSSAVIAGLVCLAVYGGTAATAEAACAQGAGTVATTYSTAGAHTFVVPAHVTSVCIDVQGAPGGAGPAGGSGGAGGFAQGTFGVTPGATLTAVVGGPGGSSGGANGGGGRGDANAGGGGGASDVRTSSGLASRVIVAGGGGGAGQSAINGGAGGNQAGGGGSGGGTGTGQAGSAGGSAGGGRGGNGSLSVNFGGGGGGGGTGGGGAGGGGANGVGGAGGGPGNPGSASGCGGGGTLGTGGTSTCPRGGGGGGGHHGGGAGGLRGGGGGGSSYVDPSATGAATSGGAGAAYVTFVHAAPPTPVFGVTPAAWDAGTVVAGARTSVDVTVSNTGTADLALPATTIAGADAFTVADATTCARGAGATLAPGATCRVVVDFAPRTAGAHAATLTFPGAAAGPVDVAMTGWASEAPTPVVPPVPPAPADPVPSPPPPAEPVAGRSVTAPRVSGPAWLVAGGVRVPLPVGDALALPAHIDAAAGAVTFRVASPGAAPRRVRVGRGRFVIAQSAVVVAGGTAASSRLRLHLSGRQLDRCLRPAPDRSSPHPARRALTVTGADVSVRGRWSVATAPAGPDVRWRTVDRCGGTFTRVLAGTVRVRDHVTGRTVVVGAGRTHRAPASR
ncbi:choice-of-anchor D domain-containing protein [Miltoncostaea oceani]|uniref:choice-of-anchor D domain-containing protein n=1 Tax=Miltoncostaea oceani TaxID=2843216 RepID=UPI002484A755|nr:choice-of-anchor D domain-containing protein [Miltoncostaea oceani]